MWMAIPGISDFKLKENGQKMFELWGGGRYGAGVLAFLSILVCGHLSQGALLPIQAGFRVS
jgi:hypothetical protein